MLIFVIYFFRLSGVLILYNKFDIFKDISKTWHRGRKVSTENDTKEEACLPGVLQSSTENQTQSTTKKYTDGGRLEVKGQNRGNDCLPGLLLLIPPGWHPLATLAAKTALTLTWEGKICVKFQLLPTASNRLWFQVSSTRLQTVDHISTWFPYRGSKKAIKYRGTFYRISHCCLMKRKKNNHHHQTLLSGNWSDTCN